MRDQLMDALSYGIDPEKYNTPLSTNEETEFQLWKSKFAPRDSGMDYDLRGAYKSGLMPSASNGHWPDTFKKPNHPTFSNQSLYAADRPDLAGSWFGNSYMPTNLRSMRDRR